MNTHTHTRTCEKRSEENFVVRKQNVIARVDGRIFYYRKKNVKGLGHFSTLYVKSVVQFLL